MPRDTRFNLSRGKKMRRPEHSWFVSHYPWELQPICIAPVLPGERLKNMTYQARAVTDPLVSSIIGWHLEYYWFYVPMTVMVGNQYNTAMSLNVEAGDLDTPFSFSALTGANSAVYFAGRGANWLQAARNTIVNEWFREEDEQQTQPVTDPTNVIRAGRPAVKINKEGIHHSLRMNSAMPTPTALGANQLAQEDAYRTYEYVREQNITQMDYEDWLRTYGVRAPERLRKKRPTLLRYERHWQYPSNTVNQATGVPVTAISWAVNGRADKDRYFTEPGFIVGMSCARPKVYFNNQEAYAASIMDRLRYWLPAVQRDDFMTSMRMDTATSSPLYDTVMAADHWVDVRDLLIHGDQYLSGTAQNNAVALPTAAGEAQFATQAMAESLFTNPGSASLFFIRQDGVCRLNILGAVEDAIDATAET